MGGFDWQQELFASLMFQYVYLVVPTRKYGHGDWATRPETRDFWWDRAHAVRCTILARSPTYAHMKVYEERRLERVRKNLQLDV